MTTSKATQDYLNKVQEIIKTTEARNLYTAIGNLTYEYVGPAHRFTRQEICCELTGEKIPLVKAGISHLADYTKAYLKAKAAAKEATKPAKAEPVGIEAAPLTSADFAGMVGKAVIRKACKRKGEVTAFDGTEGKMTIKLADGSVRRPNTDRFLKLYNFA